MAESVVGGLIAVMLVLLGLGMYYTIIGTSFAFHTTGTLKRADVYHKSGDSDSYYVSEIFDYTYNGRNSTCTAVRPKYYALYGTAQDVADSKILGTERKIWIASYNDHTCSDKKIKEYNTSIGVSLLSIFAFFLLVPIMVIAYGKIR